MKPGNAGGGKGPDFWCAFRFFDFKIRKPAAMLGASPHREQCSRRPTGRLLSALYRRMTVGVTGLTPRGSWPVRDRSYYGSVRLPAVVLHRRTSLDFTMRPRRAPLGGRRLSRF